MAMRMDTTHTKAIRPVAVWYFIRGLSGWTMTRYLGQEHKQVNHCDKGVLDDDIFATKWCVWRKNTIVYGPSRTADLNSNPSSTLY